jgi:oligoribonuclease NrnB/cAMP/cGMP phosphodiesterase (DHH superfamily)
MLFHCDASVTVVCISHREDPDGLICAAYLHHLKNASLILVSYEELEAALVQLNSTVNELYICDLNIRADLISEVIRISKFARVTVVDHHPIVKTIQDHLQQCGITLIYSQLDCASALLYNAFKDQLGKNAARFAAYAAISDRFEDGPIASQLLPQFEQQLTQHEALILTHALQNKIDPAFRSFIVTELSQFTAPHRIQGITAGALTYIEKMTRALETLSTEAIQIRKLAYVENTSQTSLGGIASLLLEALDVDVGVCFQNGPDEMTNLSIRGSQQLNIHLGAITKRLATKYGGFGGGHKKASGARVLKIHVTKFINDLEYAVR